MSGIVKSELVLAWQRSLVNPQRVLPDAEVSLESQALRDLEACDDFPFHGLVALVWRSQTKRYCFRAW
jgi:hypothetical protein